MKWHTVTEGERGVVKIPNSWLDLHYYDALTVLFRVENALRVFVYVSLKDQYKDKWQSIAISSEETGEGAISSIAKKRIAQAGSYGYLGYASTCPMLYLNSGELIHLITSETYWKIFKDSFVAGKNVVKSKLDEINTVRNALAHFRPLKREDVELVKQNAKHVLVEVESQLHELMTCRNVVPTNTEENWYVTLRELGTSEVQFRFRQSISERWVQIDLDHKAEVLYQDEWLEDYFSYDILNLRASNLLKQFPDLTKFMIYATESLPGGYHVSPDLATVTKTVSMVFSRKTLQSHTNEINDVLKKILEKITAETELIRQDNLARGILIENTSASGKRDEHGFRMSFSEMASDPKADDPPEWWGQLSTFTSHVVSGIHTYPWMPSDVSGITFTTD